MEYGGAGLSLAPPLLITRFTTLLPDDCFQLVLIRHAQVIQNPSLPPHQWELSPEGLAAARALSSHPALSRTETVYSSPEAKAIATARTLAPEAKIVIIPELRELDRTPAGWLADEAAYRELVIEILQNPERSVRGCESAREVEERMMGTVRRLHEEHRDERLVLLSHGIALTILISRLQGRSQPDRELWQRLRFPDVIIWPS